MRDIYDEFEAHLRSQTHSQTSSQTHSQTPISVPNSNLNPTPKQPSMQSFIRGQRAKISQLSDRTRRFEVLLNFCCGAIPVFDFVCFGVDEKGKLSDDRYMIFFNQRKTPDGSVALEELKDQDARFSVDLDALPAHIERLVFTASPDGNGRMSDLAVSFVTLREANIAGADAVASYRFSGNDFGDEGALLLAEIYKKGGEWRFGTIGQGFKGNLAALLKHFGGEEIGETPASQTPTSQTPASQIPIPPVSQPTVQPSPPVSLPAIASIPSNPPVPTVVFAATGALQIAIDGAPSGATIRLPRGEFQGPIVISRPLTIEGEGAVIWAQNGPVVRLQSDQVTLRGLQIEVTDPEANSDEAKVALQIEAGAPTLHHICVLGQVVGLGESVNEWQLPALLDLGDFAPRASNSWQFTLEIPVDCHLKSTVSGLQLLPGQLEAGRFDVQIIATGLSADTFLVGQIEVESAGLVRAIPISGRVGGANTPAIQNRHLT